MTHPVDDVREEVANFAVVMERCLAAHDEDRGEAGWRKDDVFALLRRLKEETQELEQALLNMDIHGAQKECADVGNFAMMIWDNLETAHDLFMQKEHDEQEHTTE